MQSVALIAVALSAERVLICYSRYQYYFHYLVCIRPCPVPGNSRV